MAKSAIYTAVTTATTVADGAIIPVGTTQRRFGCNLFQDGNTIRTCGCGYYKVDAVVTFASDSAAPVSIQLEKDGVAVPGAFSQVTVAGTSDETVLPVTAIVRNQCDTSSVLSFVANGAGITVDNFAVTVEKL